MLLEAGYWPTTYWAKDYWVTDYWPEMGGAAPAYYGVLKAYHPSYGWLPVYIGT